MTVYKEPKEEGCCACEGRCMHVGSHSYCRRHFIERVGFDPKPLVFPEQQDCPVEYEKIFQANWKDLLA
jgi:hypothetical protein